jgi:hypothetical protein
MLLLKIQKIKMFLLIGQSSLQFIFGFEKMINIEKRKFIDQPSLRNKMDGSSDNKPMNIPGHFYNSIFIYGS